MPNSTSLTALGRQSAPARSYQRRARPAAAQAAPPLKSPFSRATFNTTNPNPTGRGREC